MKAICLTLVCFVLSAGFVAAQGLNTADQTTGSGFNQSSQTTGGGINNSNQTTGSGVNSSGGSIFNPLDGGGITDIVGFFEAILEILMIFAVPIIVFFIIYAGFLYVTARGDTGKISQAHNALLYAIIGGLLVLGANVILAIVANTVCEVTGDTMTSICSGR